MNNLRKISSFIVILLGVITLIQGFAFIYVSIKNLEWLDIAQMLNAPTTTTAYDIYTSIFSIGIPFTIAGFVFILFGYRMYHNTCLGKNKKKKYNILYLALMYITMIIIPLAFLATAGFEASAVIDNQMPVKAWTVPH